MVAQQRKPRLFLDSGAHGLYGEHVIRKGHLDGYAFYKSGEFGDYVGRYAEFVTSVGRDIDYYANVDVIFNPEMSWEVLKRLEGDYGLRPMPVIHYGTDLKWIDKHLNAGYRYLGIGGLGQEVSAAAYYTWADRVFEVLCSTPGQTPVVRTHGFAIGGLKLMARYPWASVDTTRWAHLGVRGYIPMPKLRGGRFVFDTTPVTLRVGGRPERFYNHVLSLPEAERRAVAAWLEEIGISGEDIASPRGWCAAYIRFYEKFRKSRLVFPRPWRSRGPNGGGLFSSDTSAIQFPDVGFKSGYTKIYYSGNGSGGGQYPEEVLGKSGSVMLSYHKFPKKRFAALTRLRNGD